MSITLKESVNQFYDFADNIGAFDSFTALDVFETTLEFYETRITDSVLENDGDMLLLQWGAMRAPLIDKPTDLRDAEGRTVFEDSKRLYLDFTRQVLVEPEGSDVEFDNVAIQMNLTLYYQMAEQDVRSGNMWIEAPKFVDQRKNDYITNEFVRSLINEHPQKVVAYAGSAG